MNNVEIIMPLHALDSESKQHFFRECCHWLSKTGAPVHVYTDKSVQVIEKFDPFEILDVYGFRISENSPNTEWGKVAWAYEQSKAKYVAICHADDYWIERKLEYQMKYIHDAAIVFSSYIAYEPVFIMDNGKPGGIFRVDTPSVHSNFGIYYVMPSMWLINKTKVPEIKIPFQAVTAIDLAAALTICQYGPAYVIRQPLMVWNDQHTNGTHTFQNTPYWEDAVHKAIEYAKTMPQPNLKYVWE
jgi:hypothetical protein